MEEKKKVIGKDIFVLREDQLSKMFSIRETDVRGAAKMCKVKTVSLLH